MAVFIIFMAVVIIVVGINVVSAWLFLVFFIVVFIIFVGMTVVLP